MKKNRILIDVPGKFSEDHDHDNDNEKIPDSDKGLERDIGMKRDESNGPTDSSLPQYNTLPNQFSDYLDRSYPDRSYPDSGFVNRIDYNDDVQVNEPSYVMEPRLISPQSYSPIVYPFNQTTTITSDQLTAMNLPSFGTIALGSYSGLKLPVLGESVSNKRPHVTYTLPYLFVNKDSITDINFNIRQTKMKLYNYWITTDDYMRVKTDIINMFGSDDVYVTKSFFFKKSNSYTGQRVILITQIPQRPYKFINKLNRKMSSEKRTVKSVNGDYLISCDCLLIILSNYSIDYICSNYYKYHKNEAVQIDTVMKSLKKKFTCIDGKEL